MASSETYTLQISVRLSPLSGVVSDIERALGPSDRVEADTEGKIPRERPRRVWWRTLYETTDVYGGIDYGPILEKLGQILSRDDADLLVAERRLDFVTYHSLQSAEVIIPVEVMQRLIQLRCSVRVAQWSGLAERPAPAARAPGEPPPAAEPINWGV
jgi:hypothetical protein